KYNDQYRAKKKLEREAALEDLNKSKEKDATGERVPSEFNTREELLKIYRGQDPKAEFGAKPKKGIEYINPSTCTILGMERSFEEWLELRFKYRDSLWELMQLIGEGRWSEQAHRPLADFFVKKDNSRLPLDYTRGDLSKVLFSLDDQHDRLLLYPRGNRKSTISLIDAVHWIINFPDIVILICTSTKALGKKFVRVIREFFTVKNYKFPTDFQALYPDYCVPENKGKTTGDIREFWCPKRHLFATVNPTVSYTSMEAGTAGVRADVIKFDDAVDEENYKQVEQRIRIREKYDKVRELLVGRNGFTDVVGTRYTDGLKSDKLEGSEPDLYGTILKRDQEDQTLKKLIKAAWEVLPEFADVPIKQLEPHMVTLLFPDLPCVCGQSNEEKARSCSSCGELIQHSPGSFVSLIKKCKDNEINFRCQQLNQPVGEVHEENSYVNTFTEDNIWAKVVGTDWFHRVQGDTYLFFDTAMTAGRNADYSAFAVARIQLRDEQGLPPLIWFLEIRADRYTDQKVAETIAELMAKWNCGAYIEDIPTTGVLFKREVERQIRIRGVEHLPRTWFVPSQQPKAKETRIRSLQMLHDRELLRFIRGDWMELTIKQLTGYCGHTAKGHKGRKDDIPDALAYVYKVLPYIEGITSEEQKKIEEERQRLT